MSRLIGSLLGGKTNDEKVASALQTERMNDEKKRAQDLGAEEAAQRNVINSGKLGRGLLAFATSSAGDKQSLGG